MSKSFAERLNMKAPTDAEGFTGAWYSYLINDYIPNRAPEDMGIFIDLRFSATKYILYKLVKENAIEDKPRLRDQLRKIFQEKYGFFKIEGEDNGELRTEKS